MSRPGCGYEQVRVRIRAGPVEAGCQNLFDQHDVTSKGNTLPPRCMMGRNPARDAGPNSAAGKPGAAAVANTGANITSAFGSLRGYRLTLRMFYRKS